MSQLTNELLDLKRYGKLFVDQWNDLFSQLRSKFTECGGNAADAFPSGQFELRDGSIVERVRLPIPCLTSDELVMLGIVKTDAQASKSTATFQPIALTALTTKRIDEWLALAEKKAAQDVPHLELPIYQFARRNKSLLAAIREPIERFELLEKIPRASRTDTDKQELKAAQRALALGIPKPETGDARASARRQELRPDYQPPLVRSIRVPAKGGNGAIVRGGLVELGDATCVDVFKQDDQFTFAPRYGIKDAALARENLEPKERNDSRGTHQPFARLYGGMRVRIEHVGLANAFRIVTQGELATEGKFIVVGGMRRSAANDLPTPEASTSDDVKTSKP